MYDVHEMKRYSVAQVCMRLAEVLDEVERGEPAIVERKGVRYRLTVEAPRRRRKPRRPEIDILDPAVAEGRWNWDWTRTGLRFRPGRRR